MRISQEVRIEAKPETVWHWLGDPARATSWMASVSQTEILRRTPDWAGTTFRETLKEGGRATEIRGTVTAYVPKRHMAFHLEGEFNTADVVWEIRQEGATVVVSQDANVAFKGALRVFSLLAGPLMRKQITRQARHELSRLKDLCEGSALT